MIPEPVLIGIGFLGGIVYAWGLPNVVIRHIVRRLREFWRDTTPTAKKGRKIE